jgi:hypothetical protein
MFGNQPSPKALPMPKAAPEAKAPIRIVSPTEMYQIMPPTQLLAIPNTPKKNVAVQIVAITIPESKVSKLLALATMVGISGVSPNNAKLKKVTRLLVIGFSSPAKS